MPDSTAITISSPAASAWLSRPPAINWPGQLWEGFSAAWHGWRFLLQQPGLWWYALVPMLLNLLISLFVAAALIVNGYWLITTLHDSFADQFTGWGWYAALAGEILLILAVAPILLLVTVVIWKVLTTVLCGYFFSRLALEVERLIGVDERGLKPVSTGAEAAGLLFSLVVLIAGSTLLMALVAVPIIGGILSLVIGTGFACWIMGMDYLGYPLALRGLPRWRQYPFGMQNMSRAIGLGFVVSCCELLPIIGAVPLTTAVIGAVLLHRKCERSV